MSHGDSVAENVYSEELQHDDYDNHHRSNGAGDVLQEGDIDDFREEQGHEQHTFEASIEQSVELEHESEEQRKQSDTESDGEPEKTEATYGEEIQIAPSKDLAPSSPSPRHDENANHPGKLDTKDWVKETSKQPAREGPVVDNHERVGKSRVNDLISRFNTGAAFQENQTSTTTNYKSDYGVGGRGSVNRNGFN